MTKIDIKLPQIVSDSKESLKQLREVVLNNKDIKTIELCSALSKEGTTNMCIGLSDSLAQLNKKVLLFDADLRATKLKEMLSVNTEVEGIYQALESNKNLEIYTTNIPNLDIVFAGQQTKNSIEMLRDDRFVTEFNRLKEIYDYIVVDTPSIKKGVDAYTMANLVDAAAIVVRCDYANIDVVQATKVGLERTGVNILGVVFNQVKWYHKDYYIYSHK